MFGIWYGFLSYFLLEDGWQSQDWDGYRILPNVRLTCQPDSYYAL